MTDYIRIPVPIDREEDRRALCAILAAAGLEVRIVRVRSGKSTSSPHKKYVEYKA